MFWPGQINRQIDVHNIMVIQGCHVDASITHSPHKPKTKPSYSVVNDREERHDESNAQAATPVIKVVQPGVDAEARWIKRGVKPKSSCLVYFTSHGVKPSVVFHSV